MNDMMTKRKNYMIQHDVKYSLPPDMEELDGILKDVPIPDNFNLGKWYALQKEADLMTKKTYSHKDLIVWQEAMKLVKMVYDATRTFPQDEIYGLTNQVRRAAVSIPSNIAEGNGRESTKERLHFLSIANGSLAEVNTQILIAEQLKFITTETKNRMEAQMDSVGRLLTALRQSLKKKIPCAQHRLQSPNSNIQTLGRQ
jgi:four helix bundle protein